MRRDIITTSMGIDCPAGVAPLPRLLQLVSPSLPVGGFTYSQGIEWAVEAGWLTDAATVADWLTGQLQGPVAQGDLPLLLRLRGACAARDLAAFEGWTARLLATRETSELRAEEANRGRALADLLVALGLLGAPDPAFPAPWRAPAARAQLAGFALATTAWAIDGEAALTGYAWAWLEGLALAAVKLVPLGQTDGQRILARLAALIPSAVAVAARIADEAIGAASPALAIASSNHEVQYTRLFRS